MPQPIGRVLVVIALIAAGLGGFVVAPALGAKGAGMGALEAQLFEGADDKGVWQGKFEEDAYVLENRENANAVKYFYLVSRSGPPDAVAVDVRIDEGGQQAGGGLMFGFEPGAGTYYALVLRSDGTLAIYKRRGRGLGLVLATPVEKSLRPGFNELRVVRIGRKFEARLNGDTVSAIGDPNPGGGFGILVLGTGRFAFSDFEFGSGS